MYGGIVIADAPIQWRPVTGTHVRGSMIQIDGEQWLDTAEVLDKLKISRSTLWSMRKAGTFCKNLKLGRCLYYNERSLLAWMHSQEEAL